MAYLNRGEVHAEIGKSEEAKKDLLKALELDPELRESVKKIDEQYELDLKFDWIVKWKQLSGNEAKGAVILKVPHRSRWLPQFFSFF